MFVKISFLLISIIIIEPVISVSRYSRMDFQPLIIRRRLIWRKQIQFEDPKNWQPNQPSCEKDRVVLPENYVIFLNRRLLIQELILPENGELIIAKDGGGIVEFSTDHDYDQDEDQKCKTTETLYFQPSQEYQQTNSWFNPDNWHVTFDLSSSSSMSTMSGYQISTFATFHYQQSSSSSRMIIPDSERIPCRSDFITFPTNGTWKVKIGSNSKLIPTFESMIIGENFQIFNTDKLRKFLQSFSGQMLFEIQGYNHMEIQQSNCQSNSIECYCGNDQPKVMKEICQNRPKCLPSKCLDPIQAPGFCCPICATSILIRMNKNRKNQPQSQQFVYQSIAQHLERLYQQQQESSKIFLSNINLYIHWLYDNRIQIIISPMVDILIRKQSNPLIQSDQNGRQIMEKLSMDKTLSRLISIEYRSSQNWIQDSSLFNRSTFILLLIFILILLIGFFITVIYNYHHHHHHNDHQSSFTFVRFRTVASDVEMEFDNPGLSDCPSGSLHRSPLGQQQSPLFSTEKIVPNFQYLMKKMTNWTTTIRQQQQPSSIRLRSQFSRDDDKHDDNDGDDDRKHQTEFENPIFKLNTDSTISTSSTSTNISHHHHQINDSTSM
ncbi:amnion associated transmembrane protein [Dermatophagoides pteronyssinus]|uniref:amnion associated transmembrane protein n=1 Tax=Dermatophagoides pteronyssinus TaxID=6956 RepID=UPI003F66A1B8